MLKMVIIILKLVCLMRDYKDLKKIFNIGNEDIQNYMNNYYIEQCITNAENQLLSTLKQIYEKYPTEKNNENWLKFSDFVATRRGYK